MFCRFENNELLIHPESPEVFGAKYGILPNEEDIIKFAGWDWFDTEEEAKLFFNITDQ